MAERSAEFTELHPISILCATWNVNGKKPEPTEDLNLWLNNHGGPVPDLYCIGFQEIVDLNAVNVVADSKSKERSGKWREKLLETINSISSNSYVLVEEKVRTPLTRPPACLPACPSTHPLTSTATLPPSTWWASCFASSRRKNTSPTSNAWRAVLQVWA